MTDEEIHPTLRFKASQIVATVLNDLTGRRGLRQEFDAIDDDAYGEIVETLKFKVARVLKGPRAVLTFDVGPMSDEDVERIRALLDEMPDGERSKIIEFVSPGRQNGRLIPSASDEVEHVCADCGGSCVHHAMWVMLRSGEVLDSFGPWCNGNNSWCNDCEKHVQVIAPTDEVDPPDLGTARGLAVGLGHADDEIRANACEQLGELVGQYVESLSNPARERSLATEIRVRLLTHQHGPAPWLAEELEAALGDVFDSEDGGGG